MGRPEILTSAVLALAGLALALWLSATRVPMTPAPPAPPEVALPALEGTPTRSLPRTTRIPVPPDMPTGFNGLPCGPELVVGPARSGVHRIALKAPCRAGEIAEVTYGPMAFAMRLTDEGRLDVEVPALPGGGRVDVALGPDPLSAQAPAEDLVRPVAGLSWAAPIDLSLAAYEFSATRAVRAGDDTGLGTVLRLGEPGLGAVTEVYLGPVAAGPGVVRLHVGVVTGPELCGGARPLTAFEATSGSVRVRDIRLNLRACGRPGATVRLKYLLDDLRLRGR